MKENKNKNKNNDVVSDSDKLKGGMRLYEEKHSEIGKLMRSHSMKKMTVREREQICQEDSK